MIMENIFTEGSHEIRQRRLPYYKNLVHQILVNSRFILIVSSVSPAQDQSHTSTVILRSQMW